MQLNQIRSEPWAKACASSALPWATEEEQEEEEEEQAGHLGFACSFFSGLAGLGSKRSWGKHFMQDRRRKQRASLGGRSCPAQSVYIHT